MPRSERRRQRAVHQARPRCWHGAGPATRAASRRAQARCECCLMREGRCHSPCAVSVLYSRDRNRACQTLALLAHTTTRTAAEVPRPCLAQFYMLIFLPLMFKTSSTRRARFTLLYGGMPQPQTPHSNSTENHSRYGFTALRLYGFTALRLYSVNAAHLFCPLSVTVYL